MRISQEGAVQDAGMGKREEVLWSCSFGIPLAPQLWPRREQAQETPFMTPGFGEPIGVAFFGDRNVRGNG